MDVKAAHAFSSKHRQQVLASERCGCFYCCALFSPHDIAEWTDEDSTALCPRCGIDAVLGSASGVPLTRDFLQQMKHAWFGDAG